MAKQIMMTYFIKKPFRYGLILLAAIGLGASIVVAEEAKEDKTELQPLPINELRRFSDIFNQIKRSYVDEVSDEQLMEYAIRGMLRGLDPHSAYLNKEEFEDLENTSSGHFAGIGVRISTKDDLIKIVSVLPDTPASEADIQSGDIVTQINRKSIRSLSVDEVSNRMRGKAGTTVELTLFRKGEEAPFDVTLTRELIKLKSVSAKLYDENYAYIAIRQFQEPTADDMHKALSKLKKQSAIQGLILDLRNNPGGVVPAAVAIADAFLEDGLIFYSKGRHPEANFSHSAKPGDVLEGLPIIVLINSGSASASEIVAGALQDHERALILGSRSFGKGSVQTVEELREKDGVKITTGRYFTPKGRSIQAEGIEPDIKVKNLRVQSSDDETDYYSESRLEGHLENPEEDKNNPSSKQDNLAAKDFALFEALNLLKALSKAYKPQ